MSGAPKPAWGSGAPPSSLFTAAQKGNAATSVPPPPGPPRAARGRHGGGGSAGRGGNGTSTNRNQNNRKKQSGGRGGGHPSNDKQHSSINSNNNNNNRRHNNGNSQGRGSGGEKKKNGGSGGGHHKRAGITPWEEIALFNTIGSGDTPAERSVQRRSMAAFLSCRMNYLDPPSEGQWTPHPKCAWTDQTRLDQIDAQMQVIWHFKPLEVNDETRWKARSIEGGTVEEDTNEEKIRKATGILNKLSWTTLDKLTATFLDTLKSKSTDGGEAVLSLEIVEQSMHLVVDKAMTEPHFAELYASLCSKLATVHKSFRKTLLAQCQAQFEENDREESLDNLPDDPAERNYQLTILRKKYVGLMQFIGELYKSQVIKGAIMISCLERLFLHTDEEKLECFAKLMTTIGERLHAHEDEPEMHRLWDHVYSMADRIPPNGQKVVDDLEAPNTRIKFLMQDLIDLKESGWVQRRPTLKAKKISDIHAEVLEEEAAAAAANRRPSRSSMMRSQSGGSLRSSQKHPSSNSLSSQNPSVPPPPDSDGFTPVGKPKKLNMRRVQSEGGGPSSLQKALVGGSSNSGNKPAIPHPGGKASPKSKLLSPEECGKKMKSLLKEYFVGGDTADAVLSVAELVAKGQEGDTERGKAIVESAVLMLMEGKEAEVDKMLNLFDSAGESIPPASFVSGLRDPVEFLRDIEIDAPMSPNLLATILANWFSKPYLPSMKSFFVDNEDLEEFRERSDETRPADFCRQVIAKRGGPLTEDDMETIINLMSDDQRLLHPDVRSWIEQA